MKPDNISTYQGYTDNESNIDIVTLKETLQDKKMSWKVVTNEISGDHNIIELDVSSDRQQTKLERPSYNLGKADWEKLCEELTRAEPSSPSSNPEE
ncbi:hypothetical protein HN011_000911, partial [Eciton burchellii]